MARQRRRSAAAEAHTNSDDARSRETIAMVNELLSQQPVDVARLRKVAAVRGLVNAGLRRRAWPWLLGLGGTETPDLGRFADAEHRDRGVVTVDVERSLWSFTETWSELERAEARRALERVLNAAVCASGTHYYQGLHDIASVLLLTVGETQATAMLTHLLRHHLRDASRRTLEPAMASLSLLAPLVRLADPALHAALRDASADGSAPDLLDPPIWALSWTITLFAHDVPGLDAAARLFDLFLASHPLMPLYLAVAFLCSDPVRSRVLAAAREDGLAAYGTLRGLKVLGGAPGVLGVGGRGEVRPDTGAEAPRAPAEGGLPLRPPTVAPGLRGRRHRVSEARVRPDPTTAAVVRRSRANAGAHRGDADALVREALALYARVRPERLVRERERDRGRAAAAASGRRRRQPRHIGLAAALDDEGEMAAVAPHAYLRNGVWHVPDAPAPPPTGLAARRAVQLLAEALASPRASTVPHDPVSSARRRRAPSFVPARGSVATLASGFAGLAIAGAVLAVSRAVSGPETFRSWGSA